VLPHVGIKILIQSTNFKTYLTNLPYFCSSLCSFKKLKISQLQSLFLHNVCEKWPRFLVPSQFRTKNKNSTGILRNSTSTLAPVYCVFVFVQSLPCLLLLLLLLHKGVANINHNFFSVQQQETASGASFL
jgi:hypothetical protein